MPTVTLRTAVSSFSRAPRVRARPGHRPGYDGRMVDRSEPTFRRMRRRITATKRGHISSNREKKLINRASALLVLLAATLQPLLIDYVTHPRLAAHCVCCVGQKEMHLPCPCARRSQHQIMLSSSICKSRPASTRSIMMASSRRLELLGLEYGRRLVDCGSV